MATNARLTRSSENVLGDQTGEVIRCYLMAHWNGLRFWLCFASAAVERIIDGVWIVIAFLITASFVHGIQRKLTLAAQALAVLLLVAAGALLWVVYHKRHAQAVMQESRWSVELRHIVEGLQLMGNPPTLGATALISLVYLALQIVLYPIVIYLPSHLIFRRLFQRPQGGAP